MYKKTRVSTRNGAIRCTLGYFFLFICLGLSSAIIGPTLVGKFIEGSDLRSMVYLVFGSLVLNLLAFTGRLRLGPVKKPSIL